MRTIHHTMIVKAAATAAAFVVLTCCQKQTEPDQAWSNPAICFGGSSAAGTDAAITKAGEKAFGKDFIVCGIKNIKSTNQFVFPGYEVKYQNPGYSYEFGSQTVRYWDASASSYRFWAYAPKNMATVLDDEMDVMTSSLTPVQALQFHYSDVEAVQTQDFGQTVVLSFGRLGSRIRFGFYENLEGMGVKDLVFSVSGKFMADARYRISSEGISLANGTHSSSMDVPALPGPIQSDKGSLRKGRDLTDWIPVLPLADSQLAITIESCTFTRDGSTKTMELVNPIQVPVPERYRYWDTNKDYSYIFQIANVQEDFNHIIFSFDQAIVIDWVDNGAEGTYDFQP